MLTLKERAYMLRVFSLISRSSTSPFTFKATGGSPLQKGPQWKLWLRVLKIGFTIVDLLLIFYTFPSTTATRAILPIVAHGFYGILRLGCLAAEANLLMYGREALEMINQTFRMNSGFGARFLERKEMEVKNRVREVFLIFLIAMCTGVVIFFNISGFCLTFLDIPFVVYPGSRALHGKWWILLLMAGMRVMLLLEEMGPVLMSIVGLFCMTSTLFWLKKSW
jgi:hypothetical protein